LIVSCCLVCECVDIEIGTNRIGCGRVNLGCWIRGIGIGIRIGIGIGCGQYGDSVDVSNWWQCTLDLIFLLWFLLFVAIIYQCKRDLR
jgi:hypothetical protein